MGRIGLRKKQFRTAAIAWAVLLSVLSVQSHDFVIYFLPREILRNLAHFASYGFLAYLLCFYLTFQRELSSLRMTPRMTYALSLGLTGLWGGANELLQLMRPDRYPTWGDLGFDLAGAAAGLAVFHIWVHGRKGFVPIKKALEFKS